MEKSGIFLPSPSKQKRKCEFKTIDGTREIGMDPIIGTKNVQTLSNSCAKLHKCLPYNYIERHNLICDVNF